MSNSSKIIRHKNIRMLTHICFLVAIQLILSFTPLGYIPLGFIRITTVHIPVIIGAIMYGYKAGAFLGFTFGLTSFVNNTINLTITSFVFTPFYNLPGKTHGSIASLIVCFLPRIMVGISSCFIFNLIKKISKNNMISLSIAGIIGSITNTVLVMCGIYMFFGNDYSIAIGQSFDSLFSYIIITIIGFNGVIEAIVAGILVYIIGKTLLKLKWLRTGLYLWKT